MFSLISETIWAHLFCALAIFAIPVAGLNLQDVHTWPPNDCLHVLWLCLLNAVPDRLFMYNYAQLEQTKSHTRTAAGRRCQPSLMQIFCLSEANSGVCLDITAGNVVTGVSWITNACFLSNYRLPIWLTTISGSTCMQYNPVELWTVIFKTVFIVFNCMTSRHLKVHLWLELSMMSPSSSI